MCFFCELYVSSPGHEILCCMHYMIRFAPFVHSASCTHIYRARIFTRQLSAQASLQAHTPWPTWVVVPLSTLLWFGPGPWPGSFPLDSQSLRAFVNLSIQPSFYLQLNSSCTNTYTLSSSVLMTLCWSLSRRRTALIFKEVAAVLVVVVCRNADFSGLFHGHADGEGMAQDQLDKPDLQEVDFEVCSIRTNAPTGKMVTASACMQLQFCIHHNFDWFLR